MKRVGIFLLLLAALPVLAQRAPHGGGTAAPMRSAAPPARQSGPIRSTMSNWQANAMNFRGGSGGGVRVGNWTFRTGPPHRGCPGFNCVSYQGYYPSYYPVYAVPYIPSYGTSIYDMAAQQLEQPSQAPIYGDNGASQSNAYDAGYAAAMAQVATQASNARYGDHYLDTRESQPNAQASVDVIQGQPRNYTSSSPAASSISPATVLIFKDGHTAEVHNYAIIGTTLWNLSEQTARKIPLSDLDLAATAKANDERGVTFKVPGSHD